MRILAVDTSARVVAVSVVEDDRILGEFMINHKITHSQTLMPLLDRLLKSIELQAGDIDVFAASSGPGSFTGLRIGMVTIKGLAFALKKPAIGIPTLDGLAYNAAFANKVICPIIDARNNQVYTALYRWDGEQGLLRSSEYMGIEIGELSDILKEKGEEILFLGDGIYLHREFLMERLGKRSFFAPASHALQRASSIARLAWIRAQKGEFDEEADLVPFYLRKSQAERLHGDIAGQEACIKI